GGTLAAAADSLDFITGRANPGFNGTGQYTCPPIVRVGSAGGTIDTNGHNVTINAGLFHEPSVAGADGGLTVASSTPGGVLTLSPLFQNGASQAAATINTAAYASYTGPTTILTGATLVPTSSAAILKSSGIIVNAGGKLDTSAVTPALAGTQTL